MVLPHWGVPAILDQAHPVKSLDQLYFQAVALNVILIAKVQTWAAASRGCFSALTDQVAARDDFQTGLGSFKLTSLRSRDHSNQGSAETVMCHAGSIPHGYVLWEDVKEEEIQVGGKVKWAKVKAVKRSIEKSTRSYGKVSQLILNVDYTASFRNMFHCAVGCASVS